MIREGDLIRQIHVEVIVSGDDLSTNITRCRGAVWTDNFVALKWQVGKVTIEDRDIRTHPVIFDKCCI